MTPLVDEYLLFNLVVLTGPLVCAQYAPTSFRGRWRPALAAAVIAAVPFLVWDVAVTGRHWSFNERFIALWLLGLPVGEWGFFLTVPLACSYTWEMVTGGRDPVPVRSPAGPWALAALLLVGAAAALVTGREYTSFACVALATTVAIDVVSGGCLVRHRSLGLFTALVLGFTGLFNGYLTARPLVLYDARYQLDLRVGTIPIEDFVYGLALVVLNITLFERFRDRWNAPRAPLGDSVGRRLVRHRLGGYRHQVNVVRDGEPLRLGQSRHVAVVGAGLAGLRAATVLAERGFTVTVFEQAPHLGGKVGAWEHRLDDGSTVEVEHGFHAFFRHYYNVWRFLDEVGATDGMVPIADYRILTRAGDAYGFRDRETAPGLNVLGLVGTPMFSWWDVVSRPRLMRLCALLMYDPVSTFARYDGMSFAQFADRADLPPALRVVFYSFARAFFATPDRMSAAEVMKSFHFFYLSHDSGLLYDHPSETYGRSVLAPIRARLEALDIGLRLGAPVARIDHTGDRFRIADEAFDYVVLAADVVGTRAIVEASPDVRRAAPRATTMLRALAASQPNAVLRLWLDRPSGEGMPGFVVVAKERLLDSITFYHRIEGESAAWAAKTGGSVVELHCYAMPDDEPDAAIATTLREELAQYVPELGSARVLGSHLRVNRNFTAFHAGMHAMRPPVATDHPGLVLAGDWVKLDVPAMLMEAAVTSGLVAANAILRREGLREEAVYSVPLRGLLARG